MIIYTGTIPGTYGSHQTPCDVLVAYMTGGMAWYAVRGSENVNLTDACHLTPFAWVEELPDVDTFTWPGGIHTEEDLAEAVEA